MPLHLDEFVKDHIGFIKESIYIYILRAKLDYNDLDTTKNEENGEKIIDEESRKILLQ